MIIAAHCLTYPNAQQSYLLSAMLALAKRQPQHHFILITEKEIFFNDLNNVECREMQPAIKNNLSLQYWYRFKMPVILQNKKATIFISEAGMLCRNLTIPQYLFISPENKQHLPANKIHNFAYQHPNLFATQVNRAQAIFITEPFIGEIIKNKKIPCYTIYHELANYYKPYTFEEKESWINENNEGCDFFVFHVSETTKAQVLPMLKAFSIFKKWTESTLKLILFSHIPYSEKDIPKFNLYKFREEVRVVNFKETNLAAPLYASAFLHIYLPAFVGDENFTLHALQTKTALLTTDNNSQKLRFGLAAAYSILNEKAIAEKLLYYYKNDFEKDLLLAEADGIINNYSLHNSATLLSNYLNL